MSHGFYQYERPDNEPVLAYGPQSPEKAELKEALRTYADTPTEIPNVLGGEVIRNPHPVPVVMPHDHQKVIGYCHQIKADQLEKGLKSCESARKEWAELPWQDRAAVFLKAADLLAGPYRAKMNALTMLGQSKTVHQAEIDAACELADFFRFNVYYYTKLMEEQPLSPKGIWNRLQARGLEGFVYAIGPFNFTSISVNLAAAPALTGCSVIWKPAQTAALSSYVGMELLEEAGLPKGVINFVTGNPKDISQVLLGSKELSGIHFTGSTQTFNHLWKTVAQNLDQYSQYPRLIGETGGKDFIFAHPSAHRKALITAMVRGAFEYQGQKCSAASRAYLPKSLWSDIKDEFLATVESLKTGDPSDFTNFMGAVIDERAYDKITGYIDRAKTHSDCQVIAGGHHKKDQGYFIPPTVIETQNPTYETMVEELFGPVLTIYPYDEAQFEETLDLVDQSTPYALTGAIFAKDRSVIASLEKRLAHAAGNFYINDKPTGAVVGQQPFGGGRKSGTNDKAGSIYNLIRFTSFRTMKENFEPIIDYRYPYMGEA